MALNTSTLLNDLKLHRFHQVMHFDRYGKVVGSILDGED